MIHSEYLVNSMASGEMFQKVLKRETVPILPSEQLEDLPEDFVPASFLFLHLEDNEKHVRMTQLHILDADGYTFMEEPYDDWDNIRYQYDDLVARAYAGTLYA